MEITYRKVGELVPYINNARTHSDGQVAQICASIREYGWTNPMLIERWEKFTGRKAVKVNG